MYNKHTAFKGGLDVVTPPLSMRPGFCKSSLNVYQDINYGYRTYQGDERFSGQPAPSDAAYAVLTTNITGTVVLGDILTDNAGTSYGTVIAIETTYVALTKLTGTFATGNVKVLGVIVGTCVGGQVIDGADTKVLHAQYRNLAADVYRADISAVPGSGDLLGVYYFDGVWYAFRNNVGATATVMHKSTSSGWSAVDLGYELAFTSGGTYGISEGDTVEGETSGATATLTRVVLESGTFAAGTAVGKLIFASQTGTFQSETLKVGANLDVTTIAGDSSAITFAVPGGRFDIITANFTGLSSTKRMYGVDGKNRGWEFDGSVFVPIETGMITDTPDHVFFHKYQLFYSFDSSVQHCGPGLPYQWSIIVGGDEIGMGDYITNFAHVPGDSSDGALALLTRNTIGVLYGNNLTDWNLIHYKREAGAIEWSAQLIGNVFMLDDRGILRLSTSQAYGNFADATDSKLVQPWLRTKKTQLNASCIVRDLNQYWLFFADKSAMCCTIDNGKIVASMPMQFKSEVKTIHSTEDNDGNEIIMYGDDSGMVYQMYKGTSFDGDELEWSFDLSWNTYGKPMTFKRFRRAMLEIEGEGYAEFQFGYGLEYDLTTTAQRGFSSETVDFSAGLWDVGSWDTGKWDGISLTPSFFRMDGSGTNVSLKLQGFSDYHSPIRFSGAIVQFNYTRERR
jgi:hypothetical protein